METYPVGRFGPTKLSQNPICTGSSVVALMFDDGVVIAADTLLSYGKLARYKGVSRLRKINKKTLIGVGGDYADYQFLQVLIDARESEMKCLEPPGQFNALSLHSWLRSSAHLFAFIDISTFFFRRRSRLNPFWNSFVVAGVVGPENEPYLGTVNLLGVSYTNKYVATGLGSYLVQQLLENALSKRKEEASTLSRKEAMQLMRECIEILYERDTLAHYEYEVGVVDKEGCTIYPHLTVSGKWDYASSIQ
ncbi:proteasome beta 4 subunit [Trichuris trichiura]|uniref:Proteasome subunit beta n=1 Tax=Trichuris trichiura TaxID=36087 RepID=A0A077Z894_TRITR|nr:proteasome beta 4 subunit [Trichuris trichiura]